MHRAILFCALFLTTLCFAADPDHVTIDPKRNWEPMVFATDAEHPPADVVSIDLKAEHATFCSYDANVRGTFEYRLHIPTPIEHYPIFVLRYRATNLDTTSELPAVYLDVSARGNMRFRPVAKLNELVADGKDQELRVDLREQGFTGVYSRMMLSLMATEKQTGTIQVLEMRCEAAPDAQHVAYSDDAPVLVTVTDASGKPLAGANVTVDAERIGAARSAKTDAEGKITLTPLANESQRHMLQITADFAATTIVELTEETKDAVTIAISPGVIYGGFIQNEQGKPIEGATVRIYTPVPQNEPPDRRVIRRAVVRTDKQGRWQSPSMPAEETPPMFKLAHQDYVSDKEYNDTPLPPLDELKSGIGVMVLKKP